MATISNVTISPQFGILRQNVAGSIPDPAGAAGETFATNSSRIKRCVGLDRIALYWTGFSGNPALTMTGRVLFAVANTLNANGDPTASTVWLYTPARTFSRNTRVVVPSLGQHVAVRIDSFSSPFALALHQIRVAGMFGPGGG